MTDKLILVGRYNEAFNELLNVDYKPLDIYKSTGLYLHMCKRHHYKVLKYIDYIEDILKYPDFIGINPNEKGNSIEYVKKYDKHILVGIKLDVKNNQYYIATMHDISYTRFLRDLHAGRLVQNVTLDKINEMLHNKNTKMTDEPEKAPGAPDEEPDMMEDAAHPVN